MLCAEHVFRSFSTIMSSSALSAHDGYVCRQLGAMTVDLCCVHVPWELRGWPEQLIMIVVVDCLLTNAILFFVHEQHNDNKPASHSIKFTWFSLIICSLMHVHAFHVLAVYLSCKRRSKAAGHFRYTREQMISFFQKVPVAPAGLEAFTTIFRADIELPMAFIPLPESDVVRIQISICDVHFAPCRLS